MKGCLILLMTLGIVYACEKTETGYREAEREKLVKMRQEIIGKIDAVPCENADDWHPEALGSKACGGPQEYIPYPHTADESEEILSLIKEYTEAEATYNKKHNIISDCMAVIEPTGVRCKDGKPETFTISTYK